MKLHLKLLLAGLSLALGPIGSFLLVFTLGAVAVAIHTYGESEYAASQIDYGFGMAMVTIGAVLLVALVFSIALNRFLASNEKAERTGEARRWQLSNLTGSLDTQKKSADVT